MIDYADGDDTVNATSHTFTDGCDYTSKSPGTYYINARSTDDTVVDEQPTCAKCNNQFIVDPQITLTFLGVSLSWLDFSEEKP